MVEVDKRLLEGFLQELDAKIAEEEARHWNEIQRLQNQMQDIQDRIREKMRELQLALRPMREQRGEIVKRLVAFEAASHLPVIFIPTNQT